MGGAVVVWDNDACHESDFHNFRYRAPSPFNSLTFWTVYILSRQWEKTLHIQAICLFQISSWQVLKSDKHYCDYILYNLHSTEINNAFMTVIPVGNAVLKRFKYLHDKSKDFNLDFLTSGMQFHYRNEYSFIHSPGRIVIRLNYVSGRSLLMYYNHRYSQDFFCWCLAFIIILIHHSSLACYFSS